MKSKLYIKNVPKANYKLINNIVQKQISFTTWLKILTWKYLSSPGDWLKPFNDRL